MEFRKTNQKKKEAKMNKIHKINKINKIIQIFYYRLGTTLDLFAGANYVVSYNESREHYWNDLGVKNPAPVGGGMMILGFLALAVL